jgi:carbonic anhydrase
MAPATIPCTAPLNIVQNLQTDKICKLKCAYQFTYATTSLKIINGGSFIVMTPDEAATPPVNYNDINYNVQSCILVQPSMHKYNGQHTDAELIIVHTAVSKNALFVCIPIQSSSTSTADSANYFDMIVSRISQTAASAGGTTTFTNNTFTLNKFVPMKPYYSYSGTNMFNESCYSGQETIDYLVYHANAAITMTPQAFDALKRVTPDAQMFSRAKEESVNSGGVFYNPSGPTPPVQSDIYIDCQPTGDDGELLVTPKADTGDMLDNQLIKDLMGSKIIASGIKILIGLIMMIFLWKVIMRIVQGITISAVNAKPMPVPKK